MTNILTVQIKYVYNTFMFAKSDKNTIYASQTDSVYFLKYI